jgi:hypothetical protein
MLKLSVAVYRVHIDQDRVQCWALVDMVMNLKIIRRHGLDHLGDCWFFEDQLHAVSYQAQMIVD